MKLRTREFPPLSSEDRQLLWARMVRKLQVQEGTGCWLWTGRHRGGRGGPRPHVTVGPRNTWYVARVVGIMLLGLDPTSRLQVQHTCDNPQCWNPAHLYIGTQSQNLLDASDRGHLGKLSVTQVQEIRKRRANGEGPQSLGKEFGVSRAAVYHVCSGRSYGWVK